MGSSKHTWKYFNWLKNVWRGHKQMQTRREYRLFLSATRIIKLTVMSQMSRAENKHEQQSTTLHKNGRVIPQQEKVKLHDWVRRSRCEALASISTEINWQRSARITAHRGIRHCTCWPSVGFQHRAVDECFEVSVECTASVFRVTERSSRGYRSGWEERNVSDIWESLRKCGQSEL
jgi:hypothetical protein